MRTIFSIFCACSSTGKINLKRCTTTYSVTCNFAVGAVCSRIGVSKLSVRVSCGKLGLTNIADHRGNEDSCDNNDELDKGKAFHL